MYMHTLPPLSSQMPAPNGQYHVADPILEHQINSPSAVRLAHSQLANNSDIICQPYELVNNLFQPMDNGIRQAIEPVLQDAYLKSATFRCLYHYWVEQHRAIPDAKYTLQRSDTYNIAIVADEIPVCGHVLALHLHAQEDKLLPFPTTTALSGNISGERALINLIVGMLTGLLEVSDTSPQRGPITEWANLIQSERGADEPCQTLGAAPEIAMTATSSEVIKLETLLQRVNAIDSEAPDGILQAVKFIETFILRESLLIGQTTDKVSEDYFSIVTQHFPHFLAHYSRVGVVMAVFRGIPTIKKSETALFHVMQQHAWFKDLPPENYWRLSLDWNKQTTHSKTSFENEAGFMSGMNNGWIFMLENINKRFDSHIFRQLHDNCINQVCRYDTNGVAVYFETGYRSCTMGFQLKMGVYLTQTGRTERLALFKHYPCLTRMVGTGEDYYMRDPYLRTPEEHQKNADNFIAEYHHNVALAGGNKEEIEKQIVRLCVILEWAHLFEDGNARTIGILLVNFLRLQNGLPPTIMLNPNNFDGHSTDELVAEMRLGEQRFRSLLAEKKPRNMP